MKLVPYSVFGSLRLRKWHLDDEFLEDESNWYHLITESAGGITFNRSTDHPDQTFQIELELFHSNEDHRSEILETIGLPLKPGQAPDEVKALLGEPESSTRSRRHHSSSLEFKSDSPEPYSITCHFEDEKGLKSIQVTRLDVPFPQSEEELDSPPSDHQFLGEYEVLPENITSPESLISKVRLLMESNGSFRYLVHIKSQKGVTVERADLVIRNAAKWESTRIPLCLHSDNKEGGAIELTGWIDKELLFGAFLWIPVRDELANTSQYIVIEFDQWYGKYI